MAIRQEGFVVQDRDRRIAVPVVDGTEWKVHPDNPRYLISRDGKIYSLKHKKILSAETTKAGYKRVNLWYRHLGKGKSELVHRIVAKAFIPNPENKPYINHLDFNKSNNNVENLEWCTSRENNAYSNVWDYAGLATKTKKTYVKANESVSKKTLCVETGVVYKSCSEAGRQLGISRKLISRVCIGKRKRAGGYHWKYVKVEVAE